MSNQHGILPTMPDTGKNKVHEFQGGCFIFALDSEIALIIEDEATGRTGYYILNCSPQLWEEIKQTITEKTTLSEAIDFWLEKSKSCQISDWSANFDELRTVEGEIVEDTKLLASESDDNSGLESIETIIRVLTT